MLLAATFQTDNDLIATWQAANSAAWCHRLTATITHHACEENQYRSTHKYGDLRCQGCGGLGNQTAGPTLVVVCDADKGADEPSVLDNGADQDAGFVALDEIIDGLNEELLPSDNFDDVEIDLEDDELLALFPELAKDPWPVFPRFSEYQTEAPRRAVYRGRCKKCGGYMENTRERHDDNVFRCLGCGWRTSPDYERNRAIYAAGGVI